MIKHPKSEADALPEGVTVGKPKVGQTSFPTIGDRTLAYRVTVPMQAKGLSIEVYVDLIMAAEGRATAQMTFQSVLSAPEPATEQHFTKTVVDRLTRTTDADAQR